MGLDLGISALFLRPGTVGGAEHMVKNLVDGLNTVRDPADRLLLFSDEQWRVQGAQEGVIWLPGHGPANRFVREWRTIRHHPLPDVLLFPNYFTPPMRAPRRPAVTVLHDLQYLHFPAYFSRTKRLWLRAAHEATLRIADQVVVISDFVRNDLLAHYGDRWAAKVRVIPNPVSFDRFEASLNPGDQRLLDRLPDHQSHRLLLSVAAHYPHKNLDTLIRAFARLHARPGFDDVRLVLAGQLNRQLVGTRPGRDLVDLIDEMNLRTTIHVTGYVSDAVLGHLYRCAAVFAFPSLFEGFGMPPVEALGFGLPTLTTRCASLPETTLHLARYVDAPRNVEEWTDILAEMLKRPVTPTPKDVDRLRRTYAPAAVGSTYYEVLTAHANPGERRQSLSVR